MPDLKLFNNYTKILSLKKGQWQDLEILFAPQAKDATMRNSLSLLLEP